MIRFKQIASAFVLFGLYALIVVGVPHFKSRTAIVLAMFGYNALSALFWVCLVGLAVWMVKNQEADCDGCSQRPWLVWAIRFLLSVVIVSVIAYCTLGAHQWAFRSPASWDRPQFAIGWPIPWKLEWRRDFSLRILAVDILFDIFLAFFLCGFRKGKSLAFAIALPVFLSLLLVVGIIIGFI